MARIAGAIATSHTPTLGFAYDRKKQDDPVWAPIFAACGLETFQKSRNAPAALYSVVGVDARSLDWDAKPPGAAP